MAIVRPPLINSRSCSLWVILGLEEVLLAVWLSVARRAVLEVVGLLVCDGMAGDDMDMFEEL